MMHKVLAINKWELIFYIYVYRYVVIDKLQLLISMNVKNSE